jgi:hypothetical protein
MRMEGSIATGVTAIALAALVVLPLLYVLSLGPAVRMCCADLVSEKAIETSYYPLIKLAENYEPAGELLLSYITCWVPPGTELYEVHGCGVGSVSGDADNFVIED